MTTRVTIESKNHKYANTYGGNIYPSDFCTDYEETKNIASRIMSAWKFDEQCRKNLERRYK